MNKRNAFTLIELLVVISIIALLLSIVMPSLGKAKDAARLVVCQSATKQLAVSALMYTGDNNGSFNTGYLALGPGGDKPDNMWPGAFRPYYGDAKARICTSTRLPIKSTDGTVVGPLGDPKLMWGIWSTTDQASSGWMSAADFGSYGFNGWLNNPPSDINAIGGVWRTENHFRKVTGAKGSSNNIPMFVDSWWVQGYPNHTGTGALAPEFDGEIGITGHEMKRFCVNRHNGKLSASFMDGSARKIGLKELWKLKWHKNFNTNDQYQPNIQPWPDWMTGLKD